MKTLKEKIAVMQAFADGREIEACNSKSIVYYLCKEPHWDWSSWDYRIKPTPEYIPFTFEDAEFLIGKAVKHKEIDTITIITFVSPYDTSHGSFSELMYKYTFLDGSPCGKLKQ